MNGWKRWLLIGLTFLNACRTSDIPEKKAALINVEDLNDLIVPEGFDFKTTDALNFEIKLNGPDGKPVVKHPVSIGIEENGEIKHLFKIMTNENGLATGEFMVPTCYEKFVISPNYIGTPNHILIPKTGRVVRYSTDSEGLSETKVEIPGQGRSALHPLYKSNILNYSYLSGYNKQGVPNNLLTRDNVTSGMLSFINNSLPEGKNVPQYHPSYLKKGLNTDLDVTALADVWVTFIHEGAGYRNSLCYYTYPTDTPPSAYGDIDTFFVIFPNASFRNSGGGLRSGDKVKIGRFSSGTSIGFACISNGWTGSSVGNGYFRLFSDQNLNNVSQTALKQHSILLWDEANKLFYVGCEDIRRDSKNCDNDFNDLVFFIKSNPVKAISKENVPPADDGYDSDGDGVSDVLDEFPNDATLAYRNFIPSEGSFGTLSYEDCWPGKGDYDFNDLVLGYQYEQLVDANNKVKKMEARFAIRAIGAHYHHGFGFQLKTSSSNVQSVSGYSLTENKVSLNSNGTEQGQNQATFIVFENDFKFMNRSKGQFFNTTSTDAFVNPDTVKLSINFSKALSNSDLGAVPYNPFIYVGGDRGKEVHLSGYEPTQLADTSYFNTYHDNTKPGQGIYYKTLTGLPYAVHVGTEYEYPLERKSIHKGYLKFTTWASSGGSLFKDWYMVKSGYRDSQKLFKR